MSHPPIAEPRPLTRRVKVESTVIWVVFGLYLVFLLKLLLFSRVPGSERSINLIPFGSIAEYLFAGTAEAKRFAFANLGGNILVFIPLGAYSTFLWRRARMRTLLLVIVCASVTVEVIQGVFAVGTSDIDDVILNTVGGTLGVLAVLALRAKRRPGVVRTVIAGASALAAPVLCFLAFVVRLHI